MKSPADKLVRTSKLHGLLSNAQLFALYAGQGFPFGFQSKVLPLLLRQWKLSYFGIGTSNLTYLPWALRPFAAVAVERSGLPFLRRVLLLFSLANLSIAYFVLHTSFTSLQIALLVANSCAMLYDIWLDKAAILTRKAAAPNSVDLTNVIQVVGFKAGALISGSLFLYSLSSFTNTTANSLFLSPVLASALVAILFLLTFNLIDIDEVNAASNDVQTKSDVGILLWNHFKKRFLVYITIFTYKSGESIGDLMLAPCLYHHGLQLKQISGIGAWNDFVGILGSIFMAFFSTAEGHRVSTNGDYQKLLRMLIFNVIPQVLRLFVVRFDTMRSIPIILTVTTIEHFIGGALTVALFNDMFTNTISHVEATHYSIFACIEVVGKLVMGPISGWLVDNYDFEFAFFVAVVLSFVPVLSRYVDHFSFKRNHEE
jgi:PAT family beta-lactamase induction signal transducer AmpG